MVAAVAVVAAVVGHQVGPCSEPSPQNFAIGDVLAGGCRTFGSKGHGLGAVGSRPLRAETGTLHAATTLADATAATRALVTPVQGDRGQGAVLSL